RATGGRSPRRRAGRAAWPAWRRTRANERPATRRASRGPRRRRRPGARRLPSLDLEEDGAGPGARRARDRRGVEGDLTPVLVEPARDLDVGLEVDDGPDAVLQEGRVDHPFDDHA